MQSLTTRYEETFDLKLPGYYGQLKRLKEEQPSLFDEVIAFRGGSYFDCGLYDPQEQGSDQIKSYDLLALLPNAILRELSEADFWEAVRRTGTPEEPLSRREFLAVFQLAGFAQERSNFRIKLQHEIGDWGDQYFGVAQGLTGITIEHEIPATVPGLIALNRRLQQRAIPALLCRGFSHPLEIKRRLRLPMLFPVYPFISRDQLGGVIAFGRQALLLDVALRHRGIRCGGDAAIIL